MKPDTNGGRQQTTRKQQNETQNDPDEMEHIPQTPEFSAFIRSCPGLLTDADAANRLSTGLLTAAEAARRSNVVLLIVVPPRMPFRTGISLAAATEGSRKRSRVNIGEYWRSDIIGCCGRNNSFMVIVSL